MGFSKMQKVIFLGLSFSFQLSFALIQVPGNLKTFCDSGKTVEYFYTNQNSTDVTYFVSYNKKLRKNIVERSLSPQQGNSLLGEFIKSSRLGIGSRCEEVTHYN